MNYMNQFLWVIFPYLMITISIVAHIYRYITDKTGWTTKSSEFLEKKALRIGSVLFHFGIIFVFFGHVLGLLIPKEFLSSIGVSEELYHLIAISFGSLAGLVTFIGAVVLIFRRYSDKKVSVTSSFGDKFILVLLVLVIGVGLYNTLVYNLTVNVYDYRSTIGPWIRSLIVFAPDAELMKNVPLSYQIHVFLAFLTFGIWPFTRLVHVWSIPIAYFKRSNIIYRRNLC